MIDIRFREGDWRDKSSCAVLIGDARKRLKDIPDNSVHCVWTSPPYWGLRDYDHEGQLGLEKTPGEYVEKLVKIFRQVHRVLREDGTLWLNLGDSYGGGGGGNIYGGPSSGLKKDGRSETSRIKTVALSAEEMRTQFPKGSRQVGLPAGNLVGIPWRVAFALQDDGWILRQEIIWGKTNAMPEPVKNRCTKAHEQLFLFAKRQGYFYDQEAIKEKATEADTKTGRHGTPFLKRNKRSVWMIASGFSREKHFAIAPPKLVIPCVKAGTSLKGCCPHCGAPWERIIEESEKVPTRNGKKSTRLVPKEERLKVGNRDYIRIVCNTRTIGWRPGCKCPKHEPIPCTVLDPFVGSGTALEVALSKGRHAIGIDLNAEYLPIIQKRVKKGKSQQGLFNF